MSNESHLRGSDQALVCCTWLPSDFTVSNRGCSHHTNGYSPIMPLSCSSRDILCSFHLLYVSSSGIVSSVFVLCVCVGVVVWKYNESVPVPERFLNAFMRTGELLPDLIMRQLFEKGDFKLFLFLARAVVKKRRSTDDLGRVTRPHSLCDRVMHLSWACKSAGPMAVRRWYLAPTAFLVLQLIKTFVLLHEKVISDYLDMCKTAPHSPTSCCSWQSDR